MTEYGSMKEAFDTKKAQYQMRNRLNEKSRDSIIDLTEADRMQRQHDMLREEQRRNRPNATFELMESTTINRETTPFIAIGQEDKEGGGFASSNMEDEYEKYSKMFDGDADDILLAQNATIISSTLELTDSSGHNRTIVRRNQ